MNNPELLVDRTRQIPKFEPGPFEPESLVARWREELEALTGQVYGPMPPSAAMEQVIEIAGGYDPKEVLAWADEELPLPDAAQQLQAAGISVKYSDGEIDDLTKRQALGQIPVGLTGSIGGLADTGSIIVDSGQGRSRSASLLPPVHIALLSPAEIYPDLPTWMAHHGDALLPSMANLTIISGPSKTADIELNLVLGVHGPGEIHVILVE